ncbi:MAG: gene transfer agent family protein [Paracoccus sp. (in: a-proteobacteria)]|nr:gene transfer agent family protein [Paracoccus sp. (in: a-proteobacteria)]
MQEPVILNWAGGEHPFLLCIGELLALEEACNAGVAVIFGRLAASLHHSLEWYVNDVTQVIRLGLIGGGMDKAQAARLVEMTADRVGLMALAPLALSVLMSSLKGQGEPDESADDDAKKKETPAS